MSDIRLPSFNDFSPTIIKEDIRTCLQAIIDGDGEDKKVFKAWADMYFSGIENKRSTTNIPATLRSTGLSTGKRPLALSSIGKTILAAPSPKEAAKIFCAHLLREKNAKVLIEALSAMKKRKVSITKNSLKSELKSLGVSGLSNNTTDHSTLKNWFIFSGLVNKDGEPNDEEIKDILGISSNELNEFKALSLGQQVFLNLLRKEHEISSGPFLVKDILRECIESHPHLFDEAQFAKKIRNPLVKGEWIEIAGLASGVHGGRSGNICGSKKLLEIPISEIIPDFEQVIPSDLREKLNTPLHKISEDLFRSNKHKAGLALELLALRMIMDLGLEPRHFRLRSAQTAHAEVDLIAEGTHLMFSRWTFQCKRYSPGTKLGLSDVAKEVGIAVFSKAHVIVMVTTTDFSRDAKEYAREIARATHLQFVFVDGRLINKYLQDGKEALWHYFQLNAKEVMTAKREQPLPSSE